MKFYGIDCQGYLKVQDVVDPANAYSGVEDDRKLVRDAATGALYIGNAFTNLFEPIVMSSSDVPQDTYDQLDLVYHPVGGDPTVIFVSEQLAGSNTRAGGTETLELDAVRITDNWVKLSDGTAVSGGDTAGLRVEYGSPSTDTDDAVIYFDPDSGDDVIDVTSYSTKWKLNGAGYNNEPIATHTWVTAKINEINSGYYDQTNFETQIFGIFYHL